MAGGSVIDADNNPRRGEEPHPNTHTKKDIEGNDAPAIIMRKNKNDSGDEPDAVNPDNEFTNAPLLLELEDNITVNALRIIFKHHFTEVGLCYDPPVHCTDDVVLESGEDGKLATNDETSAEGEISS